jgi:hypothetical protein
VRPRLWLRRYGLRLDRLYITWRDLWAGTWCFEVAWDHDHSEAAMASALADLSADVRAALAAVEEERG